jgi:hypothetical protein
MPFALGPRQRGQSAAVDIDVYKNNTKIIFKIVITCMILSLLNIYNKY